MKRGRDEKGTEVDRESYNQTSGKSKRLKKTFMRRVKDKLDGGGAYR